MKIDLVSLVKEKKEQVNLNFTVNLGSIDYYGDLIEIPSPIQVKGKLYTVEGKAFIACQIQAQLKMNCSRCLKPAFYELNEKLNGELVREALVQEDELEYDDIIFYQDDLLDLDKIVRETILMNVPFQMLCSEDCKGICIHCGSDLNLHPCQCEKEEKEEEAPIDPRLAKLKELFKDQ